MAIIEKLLVFLPMNNSLSMLNLIHLEKIVVLLL